VLPGRATGGGASRGCVAPLVCKEARSQLPALRRLSGHRSDRVSGSCPGLRSRSVPLGSVRTPRLDCGSRAPTRRFVGVVGRSGRRSQRPRAVAPALRTSANSGHALTARQSPPLTVWTRTRHRDCQHARAGCERGTQSPGQGKNTVTATADTDQSHRELAHRSSAGIEVTLLRAARADTVRSSASTASQASSSSSGVNATRPSKSSITPTATPHGGAPPNRRDHHAQLDRITPM
jgi:hypothetical protein